MLKARLRGRRCDTWSGGSDRAARADMDALPITELNTHDFVSEESRRDARLRWSTTGIRRCCWARRRYWRRLTSEFSGELRFIFQHAEELYPGGAEQLVHAGVMEGVDVVLGAHLWLPLECGRVGVKAGALMAAPDTFEITILGSGGHAAALHETVDPIVVAAEVIVNLQHIVARNVDPLGQAVVSVTRITGGSTYNVIPGSVEMIGTVRTFDEELRVRIPELMERIIAGVSSAHGAQYQFAFQRSYRPVINDDRVAEQMRRAVRVAVGSDALVEAIPTMGGEDFSAYQERAPGCFFFVGARNEARGIVHPHHHERFDLDERALDIGTRVFVAAALEFVEAPHAS